MPQEQIKKWQKDKTNELPGDLAIKDLALSLLWIGFTAVVRVQTLAWEFLNAVGMTEGKKKRKSLLVAYGDVTGLSNIFKKVKGRKRTLHSNWQLRSKGGILGTS